MLCKSVVSEGKELVSNWPIRFQETHGFSFLIGQFDINSFPSLTTDLQSTIHIVTGWHLGVPWNHNNTLKEALQWWITSCTNDQQSSWDKLISTVVCCYDGGMKVGIKMCERLGIRYVVLPVHTCWG